MRRFSLGHFLVYCAIGWMTALGVVGGGLGWVAAAETGSTTAPEKGEPAGGAATFRIELPAVTVGIAKGDFVGDDHRALQAAVDYVAGLGGGTVSIGAGEFKMRNSLQLRDNVTIVGAEDHTILKACDGVHAALASDGGANERQITVADPSGFRLGDGVAIDAKGIGGFGVTTATLTARLGPNTFRLSTPLYLDYPVAQQGTARLVFPVISGVKVKNCEVKDLVVDGNRERSEPLDGCRGGGIYLFECERVKIDSCLVHDCGGDGVSFQVSQHVTVEGVNSVGNAGRGFHPGSGSEQAIVRNCVASGNGRDGLYVCWRVKHGLFENNQIVDNRRDGVSIGHQDTDNVFRGNTISGNGHAGVLFRDETEAMGAHRNLFEKNTILDDGARLPAGVPQAAVIFQGTHHDVEFRDNKIGNSKPAAGAPIGMAVSKESTVKADESQFQNVQTKIERKQ